MGCDYFRDVPRRRRIEAAGKILARVSADDGRIDTRSITADYYPKDGIYKHEV